MINPPELPSGITDEDLQLPVLLGKLSKASLQTRTEVAILLKDVPRRHFFDIEGLCKLTGLSRASIFRRIQAGQLHPLNLDIQRTLFCEEEVQSFLKRTLPELAEEGGEG